jgi:hypothetical protein
VRSICVRHGKGSGWGWNAGGHGFGWKQREANSAAHKMPVSAAKPTDPPSVRRILRHPRPPSTQLLNSTDRVLACFLPLRAGKVVRREQPSPRRHRAAEPQPNSSIHLTHGARRSLGDSPGGSICDHLRHLRLKIRNFHAMENSRSSCGPRPIRKTG